MQLFSELSKITFVKSRIHGKTIQKKCLAIGCYTFKRNIKFGQHYYKNISYTPAYVHACVCVKRERISVQVFMHAEQ